MDISKRIIQLREAQKISTNKLASKAGISQSYLREIELGKKNPTVEMLSYICDALNISLALFFEDSEADLHPVLLSSLKSLSEGEQLKLAAFLNEMKREQKKLL